LGAGAKNRNFFVEGDDNIIPEEKTKCQEEEKNMLNYLLWRVKGVSYLENASGQNAP
jgi:hypothetical protein